MLSFYLPLSLCFLLVTPRGPIERKKCSAPFSKVFGRIFRGKSEECAASTSTCPQVNPCALHTLQGLKMLWFPVCLLWEDCTHIICLFVTYLYTHMAMHTYTNSLVRMSGVVSVMTMHYQWHHAKFRLVVNKFLMSKASRDFSISLRTREKPSW